MPPPARSARPGLLPSLATRWTLALMTALPAYAQATATPAYPPRATATPDIVHAATRTPFTTMEGSTLHAGMKAYNAARKDRDRDSDPGSENNRAYGSAVPGNSTSGSGANRGDERKADPYCRDLASQLRQNTLDARRATTIHSRERIEDRRRTIRDAQYERGCSSF